MLQIIIHCTSTVHIGKQEEMKPTVLEYSTLLQML